MWDTLKPLILTPLYGGPATWSEDLDLRLHRRGFVEEAHFTVAYSPVPDVTAPNGIGGVLATVHETTDQVIGARRTRILHALGARSSEAKTAKQACALTAEILSHHSKDVPFALLYLTDQQEDQALLTATTTASSDSCANQHVIDLSREDSSAPWPLFRALHEAHYQLVTLSDAHLAAHGEDAPKHALVCPIPSNLAGRVSGFLIAGVSPLLELDRSYLEFFELLTSQVASSINNAHAYDEERRRAQALADLDSAKTAFFSNVSHEFRTPLTLLLGPLEEALGDTHDPLSPIHRERQEIVHRNALRLLKLVNSLLDFSRIEAGRIQARYEKTDLSSFTAEIASAFRSLVESSGILLTIDCPPLCEPVFVDRTLWEKIILNLISNAFKFTFSGEIAVRLREDASTVYVTVSDTGTGIDKEHLPHVFERFYRIEGARGRSHEGSGIGLALVHELVHLHGGSVEVQSTIGKGALFTISLRRGNKHLPQDRLVGDEACTQIVSGVGACIEEASAWVDHETLRPQLQPLVQGSTTEADRSKLILVAEDNADMRAYLRRLLEPLGEVELVRDGQEALAAIAHRMPDLVLSDIMMPNLDGFGLVKTLRDDPRTRALPIVLLSARGGEEARIEGASLAADDYIVKPFSSRELLARVRVQLRLSDERRQHTQKIQRDEQRFRALVTASSDVVYRMSPDWTEMYHLTDSCMGSSSEAPIRNWMERYVYPDDHQRVRAAIGSAISQKSVFEHEHRVLRDDGSTGYTFSRAVPIIDPSGEIVEWFGAAVDITDRKQVARAKHLANFAMLFANSAVPTSIVRMDDECYLEVNRKWLALLGYQREEVIGLSAHELSLWVDPQNYHTVRAELLSLQSIEDRELRLRTRSGEELLVLLSAQVLDFTDSNRVIVSSFVDITAQKQATQALVDADRRKDDFLAMLSHELRNPLAPISNSLYVLNRVSPGSEQAVRAHETIRRQVAHLSHLVDDLLDVTRITRGKVQLSKERLDLNSLVRSAVQDNRSLFEAAGITLEFDSPAFPVVVLVDQTRIVQVVGNLLHNCSKFTPRGGVTRIKVTADSEHAVVEVADTGVGMSPDTLQRIFEPFSQAEQGLDRNRGGLGLGLALVKGMIELHGGSVDATSRGLGRGTEVTLKLPLTEQVPTQIAKPPERSANAGRILIIEDNVDSAETLREVLLLGEHAVEIARDGKTGLEVAKRFRPNVVLCDIGLPGMNGYEVARALRSEEQLQDTYLVALSGYAQPEDVQRGVEAGFNHHLAKPLNFEHIEQLLSDISRVRHESAA